MMNLTVKYRFVFLISAFLMISFSCKQGTEHILSSVNMYDDIEFDMPVVREPVIPGNTVSIVDFGAIPDGQTLNTGAFEKAIEELERLGGGKLVIPRGIWLTGPIILKSNLEIHAGEGALVIFSGDKNLYPLIETSFEGYNTVRCLSPIYGKDLENIAFTGKGIFDGTGEVWRPVKKDKLTESQWKTLVKSGGIVSENGKIWFPSRSYMEGQRISEMNVPRQFTSIEDYAAIKDFLRPVMVSLVNCKKVLLDGPVFQNSPAWCLHPLMCEDLTIRNITVKNPWFSQNGDGLDIESCKNTVVYNANFDVGDDAICIKSGKDEDGRKRGIPAENLVIKNCVVYHGHGGVTIGSEMSGGVRNIHVSNCTFIGTDVGLRFKSNRGRGGVVEKIYFSNIDMINIPTFAISFNLYYNGMSVPELLEAREKGIEISGEGLPVTEETPAFRDIHFRGITCKGALQAVSLQGLPELNLQDVSFENMIIEATNGLTCMDAAGISMKDVTMAVKGSPALYLYNSRDIRIENLGLPGGKNPLLQVAGKRSKNISLHVKGLDNAENAISLGSEVDAAGIEIR